MMTTYEIVDRDTGVVHYVYEAVDQPTMTVAVEETCGYDWQNHWELRQAA